MKISIIGFGLIGSSIARAVINSVGDKAVIQAIDSNRETLATAKALGICHKGSSRISDISEDADFIVLATPVGASAKLFERVVNIAGPSTIITDVGSVKSSLIKVAERVAPKFDRFVPAHPMAGSHLSGPEHGSATLFRDARIFITPYGSTSESALSRVRSLFASFGGDIHQLCATEHDAMMAYVSHVPHFLAYAYMKHGRDLREAGADYEPFCAGGYRDFTRIAQSDVSMWIDIFKANRKEVLKHLEASRNHIEDLMALLKKPDYQTLQGHLNSARDERLSLKLRK